MLCANCGADIADGAAFCPKCGVGQGSRSPVKGGVQGMVEELCSYNLSLDRNALSWEYVQEIGESRAEEITHSLATLTDEMGALAESILSDPHAEAEQKAIVHRCLLNTAIGLCDTSQAMLRDADGLMRQVALHYNEGDKSGLVGDFKKRHYLDMIGYYSGQALDGDPSTKSDVFDFYDSLERADQSYRVVAMSGLLCAVGLKSRVDSETIETSKEYQLLVMRLANSFDDALGAFADRMNAFCDIKPRKGGKIGITQCIIDEFNAIGESGAGGGFYEVPRSPSLDYMEKNFLLYREIVSGLTSENLAKITASGWAICLRNIQASTGSSSGIDDFLERLRSLGVNPQVVEWDAPLASKAPPEGQATGGCYVATAVYGSYDCPQVWVLRRYRDNVLAESWYGRVFVKAYYAVSPTLVALFGETSWFKGLWRERLDRMVCNLQKKGFESTPYEDRCW